MKKAVIISCFGWYEKRLYYLYKRLEEAGYEVTMFVSDYQHIKKRVRENDNKKVCLVHVPQYKKNLSIKRLISHYIFALECFKRINMIQPNLIYGLVPPNSIGNILYKYKKKNPESRVITDVIDLWPESFPIDFLKKTVLYSQWEKMRTRALDISDAIILECDYYRTVLGNQYNNKYYLLRLFKESKEIGKQTVLEKIKKYKCNIEQQKIKLCYLGSINNIIDIKSIEAIVSGFIANKYTVEVCIIGRGDTKKLFLNRIQKIGALVIDCGAIFDEKEKCDILTSCDFGLNLMLDHVKVGLTLKSMEYLYYGLPIISNIKGDTWKIIEERKVGVNYKDNIDEIINFVEQCEMKHMKMNALECFHDSFSREAFESTYEDILLNMKLI